MSRTNTHTHNMDERVCVYMKCMDTVIIVNSDSYSMIAILSF